MRRLKAKGDRSLRTVGSLSLCPSLLRAGLADRFRVAMIFPAITGLTGSERIYDGYPDVLLEMTGSRLLDRRIQVVEYAPAVYAAA